MLRTLVAAAVGLAGLFAASAAAASPGFTTTGVNMRAGPAANYPKIAFVPRGSPVEIFGCVRGYSWCDVQAGYSRGWVSAKYLQAAYGGNYVYLPQYAPTIGLPIISFNFGYWDNHYRGHGWYRDRYRYGYVEPRPVRPYRPAPGYRPDPGHRPRYAY